MQREVEARRDQPAPTSASQGLDSQPQTRRVESSSASSYGVPATLRDIEYQRPLSSRAAQALASYTTTASLNMAGAEDVLGLDLYA